MEDDIDIEEHDVLDNPHIRTIFPDIAQIKAEIPDDNYDEPDQEMEYEPYLANENPQQNQEDTSEYTRFANKIILGSKPTSSILESTLRYGTPFKVKQEIDEYEEEIEEHYQPSTVLIIGSKPSKSGVITPFTANDMPPDTEHLNVTTFLGHEIDVNDLDVSENDVTQDIESPKEPRDPSSAFVLIEDWGPRLQSSSCYCKECQILFATHNTLLAHNMTAHSFLVALDKNKAVKSTSKTNNRKEETGKLCNHCNKMFPDSDSLINHLYMTFDKKAVFKNQPKKVVANPFSKQVNANLVRNQKRDVAKPSKVYAQGATDLFRCEVCGYYCEMYWAFLKHMKENHCKTTFSQDKEVFNGQCPHCDIVLKSKLVYNRHIQANHRQIYKCKDCDEERVYRCDICSYYFERKWALLRHMKKDHGKKSILNYITQKQVVFDSKCPHCSSIPKSKKYYNKHMKAVHCNLVCLKSGFSPSKGDNIPTPKKIAVIRESEDPMKAQMTSKQKYSSCNFQCRVCFVTFINYTSARCHRIKKHPEFKTQRLIKKLYCKTDNNHKARVPSKIVMKYPKNSAIVKKEEIESNILPSTSKSPQKNNDPNSARKPPNQIVIPKSVLFKCNKCDFHFTSCTATVLHAKCCGEMKEEWKCNICKRLFKTFDQTVHNRQHQVSDKFKVIVYHENIYGRVLNRCPNCELYFHEKEFYLHDQKEFCRGTGVKCDKCSVPIHTTSLETHNKWHERIKNIKKTMVLVEFVGITCKSTSSSAAKRVLDFGDKASSSIPTKKVKTEKPQVEKKHTAFYCPYCGIYMFNQTHLASHIFGKCKSISNKAKMICKVCGLTYSSASHPAYHKTHPNISIMDMTFQSLKDKAVISPPIPNFPGCKKCKVHFCRRSTVTTHNCKDSYKTCKHCNKRYSDLAYKLHMKFHDYQAMFKAHVPDKPQNSAKDPMPELLKEYKKLTDTWNILYLCSDCDIVFDNYDKVVDHSQKHFNNMESYDTMIEYCAVCQLKFDGACFERHEALHAQNGTVNKSSFTVCPYQYKHLLTAKWLDDFRRVIPETKMQQILSKSIYANTSAGRSIKLRVVEEGPPENTLYRCAQCELYIHPQTLSSHYKNVSCDKNISKHHCSYCGIAFTTLKARHFHQDTHKTAKSYNVVYFNEHGDKQFNEKLSSLLLHNKYSSTIRGKRYHFYKCAKCTCCMSCKSKTMSHVCTKKEFIKQCDICLLNFSKINRHKILHKTNPRLTIKNIKCTWFERGPKKVMFNEEVEEKTVIKLYKCHCGLHFTSMKAIDKHFEVCGDSKDVIKEKCSKCQRLFDTNQLVTHLCKHHSNDNDKDTEFEIIVLAPRQNMKSPANLPNAENNAAISTRDKRKNLFKCHKCNVYYLSQGGLAYHFEMKHQVFKIVNCPHCKLRFMPKTLQSHIKIQHKMLGYKLNDFIIYIGVINSNGSLRIKSPDSIKNCAHENSIIKGRSLQRVKPVIEDGPRIDYSGSIDKNAYNNELYKCDICDMYLLTLHSLISHQMRDVHNYTLVRCPDCSYTFSRFSYFKHYRAHHKVMNLKRADFQIVHLKDRVKKRVSYKNDTIDSDDKEEKNHMPDEIKKLQEGTTNVNAVKKYVSSRKSKYTNHENKEENEKDGQTQIFKNTNVLYECGICKMTFLASTSIHFHIKCHLTNEKIPAGITCSCGLIISASKMAKHEILHHDTQNLTRDDLYTITMGTHGGIVGSNHLFKCEICHVHLHNMTALENHLNAIAHNTKTRACTQCGLLFTTSSGLTAHIELHHNVMKLRLEDLVILQSVGQDAVKVITSPTSTDSKQTELIRSSPAEERRLYNCSLCDTYHLTLDGLSVCKHEAASTAVCENCNLRFTEVALASHLEAHHSSVDLKKEDFFVIYSRNLLEEGPVSDNKELASFDDEETSDDLWMNLTTLYKCNGCCTHFLREASLYYHYTGSTGRRIWQNSIKTCQYCGLNFLHKTFLKHIKLHKIKQLTREDFHVIEQPTYLKCPFPCNNKYDSEINASAENNREVDLFSNDTRDSETFDIDKEGVVGQSRNLPEENPASDNAELASFDDEETLDDSQTDLTENSTTLYKCNGCGTHFLHKKSLYYHCTESRGRRIWQNSVKTCQDCGFNFLHMTFLKHLQLHKIKQLTREDFHVIEQPTNLKCPFYCNKKYESEINASAENNRDVDASIRDTRDSETFDIDKEGVVVGQSRNLPEENPASDNAELASFDDEETLDDSQTDLTENLTKLYKCNACGTHFLHKDTLHYHCSRSVVRPTWQNSIKTCQFCGLNFLYRTFLKHLKLHKIKMLTREDFHVIEHTNLKCPFACNKKYDSEINASAENNRDVDTRDSETFDIDKEVIVVRQSRNQPEENPSSDNVELASFDDEETLDDTQTDLTENSISTTLYKCNGCNAHFLHKKSLYTHCARPRPRVRKQTPIETCQHCGLDFLQKTMLKHIELHKIKKLTREDFHVIEQLSNMKCPNTRNKKKDNSKTPEIDASAENTRDIDDPLEDAQNDKFYTDKDILEKKITVQERNKLYQCVKCECCFLTSTNVRDHYIACQYVQTYVKCDKCQLKFHKSLNMHLKLHHETQKLELKDLDIVRYSPENEQFAERLSPIKLIESSETLSTLDEKLYTNKLFKCGTCSLHFLIKGSLELHTENPKLKLPKSTCTFCGLAFSANALPTHIYIHHENMKLSAADFCVTVEDEIAQEDKERADNCSIDSGSYTLHNSKKIATNNGHRGGIEESKHCKPDDKIIEKDAKLRKVESSSAETPSTSLNGNATYEPKIFDSCDVNQENTTIHISPKSDAVKMSEIFQPVKLYKCAVCNVCFLNQTSCYKHTVNHVVLDPKDYIECKLCGYQFLILNNCLHKHVTKHHKRPFKPEQVLIEEYHPDIQCYGTPKIDIYFGTDKLQSKLISTTSDGNISSELSENSEAGDVTSAFFHVNADSHNNADKNTTTIAEAIESDDKVVNNSGNDTDLYANDTKVSLDDVNSSNSIIDLDKSSDVVVVESSDEDIKPTCDNMNSIVEQECE